MSKSAKADANTSAAAHERVRKELEAIPDDQLIRVNADLDHVLQIANSHVDGLLRYASQMKKLEGFNHDSIDKLPDYILALYYTHQRYVPPTQDHAERDTKTTDGTLLKRQLLAEAEAQVLWGRLRDADVAPHRPQPGHQPVHAPLTGLAAVFIRNWSTLAGHTGATREAVDKAAVLGTELFALETKEPALDEASQQSSLDRTRAWTRLVRAWDECRVALAFVRRAAGDADEIAPSLHTANKPRKPAAPASAVDDKSDDDFVRASGVQTRDVVSESSAAVGKATGTGGGGRNGDPMGG